MRKYAALLVGVVLVSMLAFPLSGQGFGQNKVQYDNFDWKVLSTERFDIHYYPEADEAAVAAAIIAERHATKMDTVLDHELSRRVNIILYATHPHFQQTNIIPHVSEGVGGVATWMRERIVMPLGPTSEHFAQVLRHEIVHQYQYDFFRTHLPKGADLKNFDLSLWFIEGMAEYLSKGYVDNRTHMAIRDAVYGDYMRSIAQMQQRNDYLSYRFGEHLWWYIGTVYGDVAIGKILKRSVELVGVFRAFSELGIDPEKLDEEWSGYVKAVYGPQLRQFPHMSAFGVKLTDHGPQDPYSFMRSPSYNNPAVSPDGTGMVYVSDRGNDLYGFRDLWEADAVTGEALKRIVETGRSAEFESLRMMDNAPGFSYDGASVIFSAQYKGRYALYRYDRVRGKTKRITLADREIIAIENPRFCGNDERIVFTGVRASERNIYLADADGRNVVQLTDDAHTDIHPVCSSDGRTVAFSSDRGSATDFGLRVYSKMYIVLLDIDSGDVRLLPGQDEGDHYNPAWSPDGKWLAFVSDKTGIANLFLWSFEEGRLYQRTDVPFGVMGSVASSPAISWASEANVLIVTAFEDMGFNLYRFDDPQDSAWVYDAATASRPEYRIPERRHVEVPVYMTVRRDSACAMIRRDSLDIGMRESVACPEGKARKERRDDDMVRITLGVEPLAADDAPTMRELLDDSTFGFPNTTAFTHREYKAKLALEGVCESAVGVQIGNNHSSGASGGACVLFSDLLGDRNMLVAANPSFGGHLGKNILHSPAFWSYVNLKHRTNWGVFFQQTPQYYLWGGGYVMNEDGSVELRSLFIRDVNRSVGAMVSHPLDRFKRMELSIAPTSIQRDALIVSYSHRGFEHHTENLENVKVVGVSTAYVKDNALPGFTHHFDGTRMRIGAQHLFGGWNITTAFADVRRYHDLGGQTAFAVRLLALHRFGDESERFIRYWGDPSVIRGYGYRDWTFEECARSAANAREGDASYTGCPARDQLIGTSVLAFSAELRRPLLDPLRGEWRGPPISGALFVDAGVAFNDLSDLKWIRKGGESMHAVRAPLVSAGAELRAQLGYIDLRFGPVYRFNRNDLGLKLYFAPVF